MSSRGIEANPEKINTIDQMRSPIRLKEVQKLTGCMAALSRFISRMGEKGLPLFKVLKKNDCFIWMLEVEAVSEISKGTSLPLLY